MTIVCNIWMICLELNWLFYDPSWMLHLSEFVCTLRFSVWAVFNNFLLIDATDRNKIIAIKSAYFHRKPIYPLSFFALMKVFIQRGGDFYASRNYLTKRIRGFDCAIEMNISNKIKKKIIKTYKIWKTFLCSCQIKRYDFVTSETTVKGPH